MVGADKPRRAGAEAFNSTVFVWAYILGLICYGREKINNQVEIFVMYILNFCKATDAEFTSDRVCGTYVYANSLLLPLNLLRWAVMAAALAFSKQIIRIYLAYIYVRSSMVVPPALPPLNF